MKKTDARIDMSHGAGGRAMGELIATIFRTAFDNPALARGEDQAILPRPDGRIAFATDTFVISPPFFPGGNIGSLAVHGTVNDLAMGGATPLWLSAGFVIEEGYPLANLEKIASTMGAAARAAGVVIVTGDTKVVERGKGDGVFINTAGVGVVPDGIDWGTHRIAPGDKVIVSGTIGDHGVAVMALRAGMAFDTTLQSDCAALNGLMAAVRDALPDAVHAMRDPTRGGLAATLNEFAESAGVGIALDEAAIPVRDEVTGACELFGLDPLNVANEGKLVAVVDPGEAEDVVDIMRRHPLGKHAAIIGAVTAEPFVRLRTRIGGERLVAWLSGDQLPRIC